MVTLLYTPNQLSIRVCAPVYSLRLSIPVLVPVPIPVPLPAPAYRHEFMRDHTDTHAPLHRPIIRIISTPSQSCHRHVHSSTCARHHAKIPE